MTNEKKWPGFVKAFSLVLAFIFIWRITPLYEKYTPEKFQWAAELVLQALSVLITVVLADHFGRKRMEKELQDLTRATMQEKGDEIISSLSDIVIPCRVHYGLKRVIPSLDFAELFRLLEDGDIVEIFFTFHSQLSVALIDQAYQLARRHVQVRLLLAYDKSPETIRRFHEIERNKDDPHWAGHRSEAASAINQLDNFLRKDIPFIKSTNRHFNLDYKVYDHLPDHPIIVVRNESLSNPYYVRFVWLGVYLERAAIRMPVVEWIPIPNEREESIAIQCATYFYRRWKIAKTVEEMDALYQSGERWLEDLRILDIAPSRAAAWIKNLKSHSSTRTTR